MISVTHLTVDSSGVASTSYVASFSVDDDGSMRYTDLERADLTHPATRHAVSSALTARMTGEMEWCTYEDSVRVAIEMLEQL